MSAVGFNPWIGWRGRRMLTAITDLLTQGVPLEDVQYLAGRAEPRTIGLYDRRKKSDAEHR
jgi:hypothetical protein